MRKALISLGRRGPQRSPETESALAQVPRKALVGLGIGPQRSPEIEGAPAQAPAAQALDPGVAIPGVPSAGGEKVVWLEGQEKVVWLEG